MTKQTKIIIGLSLLVLLLVIFIGYSYWDNYQQEKYFAIYQEAQLEVVLTILEKIQTDGYVQLNLGNETITLVPYQG